MPAYEEELVIKTNRSWSLSDRAADGRHPSSSGFSSRAQAIARLQEILSQIDQGPRTEPRNLSSAT
jgi:hypothetical protein